MGSSGYRKMACNGDWVAASFGDGGRRLQGTDQTGIGSNRHGATSLGPTRVAVGQKFVKRSGGELGFDHSRTKF
jgi:hypothetical protein